MLKRAFIRNDNEHIDFPADRVYRVNELVQKHGKVGVVTGERDLEVGEQVTIHFDKRVELEKDNAADVFAEDAAVFYDGLTGKATLAASTAPGAVSFKAGIAVRGGSTANEKTVMVMLYF